MEGFREFESFEELYQSALNVLYKLFRSMKPFFFK
jgi:hypothetical protein